MKTRMVIIIIAIFFVAFLTLKNFFSESKGKISVHEMADILPMEENFLLLFRRDNPLESSIEFMKVWKYWKFLLNKFFKFYFKIGMERV